MRDVEVKEDKLLREMIQSGLLEEAENKLREVVRYIDYARERLTGVKNLLGLQTEELEPDTELLTARNALGKLMNTLSKDCLNEEQKRLFDDALENLESAEIHIRWVREQLGNTDPCTTEIEVVTAIKLMRAMKYR